MTGKLAVVFGGSGFVGRNVVRELASRGWRVRVAVRRPHLAQFLRPMGSVGQIQLAQANVRYPDSIAHALQGADAVVNLVGILAETGSQKFDRVQAEGSKTIARLAAEAGITNFAQISAIGADLNSDSLYARTKAEGEAAVRACVPSATILRPSLIFGLQDQFFNRFAQMARFSPILPLIGGGKTKFQPVYVDDVADAICLALDSTAHQGKTYELGGPEVFTFKELMDLMLRIIGRQRLLAPVPFPVAGLLGSFGDFANFFPLVNAPLTSDQVTLLKQDTIVGISGDETIGTLSDFGITPETVQAIAPTYLARFRKYGQFSPETA